MIFTHSLRVAVESPADVPVPLLPIEPVVPVEPDVPLWPELMLSGLA